MEEITLPAEILKWLEYIAYAVTICAAICKAAEWIVKIIPGDKDDKILAGIEKVLVIIQQILRIPALNPKPLPCPPVEDKDKKKEPDKPKPKEEEVVVTDDKGNVNDY